MASRISVKIVWSAVVAVAAIVAVSVVAAAAAAVPLLQLVLILALVLKLVLVFILVFEGMIISKCRDILPVDDSEGRCVRIRTHSLGPKPLHHTP